MKGWSTKKGIFATEDATEYYPYRSESATNSNVKIRLKFDPKDSVNQCLYEAHRGYNVSAPSFNYY